MHLSERGTVEVQLVVDHFVYSFLHFVHIVDGHSSCFVISQPSSLRESLKCLTALTFLVRTSVNHQFNAGSFQTLSRTGAADSIPLIPLKAVRQSASATFPEFRRHAL